MPKLQSFKMSNFDMRRFLRLNSAQEKSTLILTSFELFSLGNPFHLLQLDDCFNFGFKNKILITLIFLNYITKYII